MVAAFAARQVAAQQRRKTETANRAESILGRMQAELHFIILCLLPRCMEGFGSSASYAPSHFRCNLLGNSVAPIHEYRNPVIQDVGRTDDVTSRRRHQQRACLVNTEKKKKNTIRQWKLEQKEVLSVSKSIAQE